MTANTDVLEDIVGLVVYARIHDQLGNGVELVKSKKEGYLYRGTITGAVCFGNGEEEKHFSIAVDKPIIVHRAPSRLEISDLLITPRYIGEGMNGLLDNREITVSYSHVKGVSWRSPSASNVLRLKKAVFDSNDFVWIGIGELSVRPSERPFTDAPWEMHVSDER